MLATELANGHPITGPYSADASDAAEELNATNIDSFRVLKSNELIAWAATGPRAALQDAADDPMNPVRSAALAALDLVRHADAALDLNDASRMALVDALVSGGVLDAADKTSLTGLAATLISRAEQLGLGTVRAGAIERARA